MSQITIRQATFSDLQALIDFNQAMAAETEGIKLVPEVISAGVEHILRHPEHGFYLVAERDQEIVGGLMVTTEWSDWRNGLFWWVQSVYVMPAHRRQGVYRQLYRFVQQRAHKEPHVCGFRLYVERENQNAQETYRALGMTQKPYIMFEELKQGTIFSVPE